MNAPSSGRMVLAGLTLVLILVVPELPGVSAFQSSTIGEQKVLVIPVDFADVTNSTSLSSIAQRMDGVNHYIGLASYNKTWLTVTILSHWIRLNGSFSHYAFGINPQRCPAVMQDTLSAAQKEANFSDFSQIMVIHAKVADDFHKMRPEETAGANCLANSSPVRGIILVSEGYQTTGWVHEMLHAVGGDFRGLGTTVTRVPDLYDEEALRAGAYNTVYVGGWDIMSNTTGGMTAWTRMKLGWIPAANIVTLSSWNNVLVNITSLDVSTGLPQVIRIPIMSKQLTLPNGSNVDGSTYYLVEYRTPAGIDRNLSSPTVLITRTNDTRYYAGQSGPVVVWGVLSFSLASPPQTYTDRSLNLSISILYAHNNTADFLITNSRSGIVAGKVQTEVYHALQGVSRLAQLSTFLDIAPPSASIRERANGALNHLLQGNLAAASSWAEDASSQLTQHQNNLIVIYRAPSYAVDIVSIILLILYVIIRRPPAKHERYFVFRKFDISYLLVLFAFIVVVAIYYQTSGLSEVISGITNFSNGLLSTGVFNLALGTAAWLAFIAAAFLTVRRSIHDLPDEENNESEVEEGSDGATQERADE